MIPHRVHVKYFVSNPDAVELHALIPVFHEWIRENKVSGLLIDVADYSHVPDGPGLMIIGHEGDYSLDLADGRPGLMYARKRDVGNSLQESVEIAMRHALEGAQTLTQDVSTLTIDVLSAEITFADALATPNSAETFAAIQDEVATAVSILHPGKTVGITQVQNDARLGLKISVSLS